jgi:hypothetical protein
MLSLVAVAQPALATKVRQARAVQPVHSQVATQAEMVAMLRVATRPAAAAAAVAFV